MGAYPCPFDPKHQMANRDQLNRHSGFCYNRLQAWSNVRADLYGTNAGQLRNSAYVLLQAPCASVQGGTR